MILAVIGHPMMIMIPWKKKGDTKGRGEGIKGGKMIERKGGKDRLHMMRRGGKDLPHIMMIHQGQDEKSRRFILMHIIFKYGIHGG